MKMDNIIFSETEFIDEQGQSITQQNNGWMYSAMYPDCPLPESDFWPPSTLTYQQLSQQRFSTSTHSSFATDPRTSLSTNVSLQWQPSSSSTSTRSSWSNSAAQRSRQASLASTADFQSSMLPEFTAAKAPLSPAPSSSKKKASQRHLSPEKDKDHFATCVSRKRRTRRSQREPRYWCTSCEEPFVEKYDWKRHEETYQERRFVFSCSLCSASYFLEKDFVHHHRTRHNCETCQRDEHEEAARRQLQARTGWGCGFCTHFSSDWKERCNHIAQHFESGRTMNEWYHSNVIQSLLQRPAIRAEWNAILHSQPQLRADFGWNQRNTGRTEGYPESHLQPHLQDLLEYYRPGDNAFELAQLAFRKIAFPARPPQAPRKDYKNNHTATLQSLMDDPVSWNRLMSTIPEDDVPPTAVCELNFDITRGAFDEDDFTYF